MTRRSVLIPDGESPFALHVLACLYHVKDLDIHILSQRERALTRFSRGTRSFHVLGRGKSLLEGVTEICSKRKIDLCMPVDTDGIYYFAQHREQLEPLAKLFLIESTQILRLVWDKGLLADFLFEHQLPHPATITSRAQFEKDWADLKFPVLIKPRLAGGGVGIEKFTEREVLLNKINTEADFFDQYIVQSYLTGNDIDCSVLCKDGKILAYTIQKGLYENEAGSFQAPEAIEFLHESEVFQVTTELMAALRWNGVAHVDLRKRASDGQVVVIEINPRFWGSLEGSLHAGVNFPQLAMRASMGEEFPVPEFIDTKYASALSAIKRKLKNKPTVSLMHETNLLAYFQDPLPALAHLAGFD